MTSFSIYVFGGGSANRVRFNDTLKLTLDYFPGMETQITDQEWA